MDTNMQNIACLGKIMSNMSSCNKQVKKLSNTEAEFKNALFI